MKCILIALILLSGRAVFCVEIVPISADDAHVVFCVTGLADEKLVVETCNDMVAGQWNKVPKREYTVAVKTPTNEMCFYRVKTKPGCCEHDCKGNGE